jgi:hypothetical protein
MVRNYSIAGGLVSLGVAAALIAAIATHDPEATFAWSDRFEHLLLCAALLTATSGLTIWFGLANTRWPVRLATTIAGSAVIVACLQETVSRIARPFYVTIGVSLAITVLCGCLIFRMRGFRLCQLRNRALIEKAVGPSQIRVSDLLLWLAACGILLAVIRPVDLIPRVPRRSDLAECARGVSYAVVSLAVCWASATPASRARRVFPTLLAVLSAGIAAYGAPSLCNSPHFPPVGWYVGLTFMQAVFVAALLVVAGAHGVGISRRFSRQGNRK